MNSPLYATIMLSTTTSDCDDCTPRSSSLGPLALFSTSPFIATFALVTLVAYRKVYPLLSAPATSTTQGSSKTPALPAPATYNQTSSAGSLTRRIAALTFSSTIALSAVLTELLLCEISNSFNPTARSVALQVTVVSLLGLLVVAIPLVGIHTVVTGSSYAVRRRDAGTSGKKTQRWEWLVEAIGYAIFLGGFWALGALLPSHSSTTTEAATSEMKEKGLNLLQACLDRLGITGVTLMALLSGFASVSAIWQVFGPKTLPVAESDISRKQAGLDATVDMIAEKRTRLHTLQRRMTEKEGAVSTNTGFWSRASNLLPLNKSGDTAEKQTLEMEVTGLETMASSLESTLSVLRARRADQLKAQTPFGRLQLSFNFAFACYCVYRIIAVCLSIFRRVAFSGRKSQGSTDPVTYTIALFARHVYPSLDQASWAQQISFLLSGIILLASFNAVTQTFYLFARLMPGHVLHATRTNFALLISQVSGMYVISSALMLRGMMPERVGGVIDGALGGGMEAGWTGRWFEGWFAVAVVVTAVGIAVGRSWGWEEDVGWDRGGEMKGA